jgi:peptide/nickel transport system substrate-binding protein
MPMITAADNSVFTVPEFDYQMYRPLYWLVNGVEPKEMPSMSLANDPVWSNGDKTVTFTLKSTYKWSNGDPVTSQDVLFFYYVLKAALKESAANWAYYTPGVGFPDLVTSITAPDASTVTINLKSAVNPTWFWEDEIGVIQPMPSAAWDIGAAGGKPVTDWATNPADAKKIYDYLAAASKSESTWVTSPLWQVVDGPYKLKSGSIDAGYVPLTDVPQSQSLTSTYNEFGYSDFGWNYITYNFKDTTGDFNNIIDKLYIRQALAHLEDEPGYIHAFFNGAGGQAYGPVPQSPSSPFTPANAATDPYPFSTADAASLLKANGWTVVPNGTDTCTSPGTGAGQCGAGIPAGTKLEWNVIYGTNPSVLGEQTQDWASQAKTVGITMNLSSSNFNFQIANYNDPASPKTIDKWAMDDFGGFTDSTYPTTFGVFNSGGSSNIGGYADPRADALINASVSSSNPAAVTAEAEYLTQQQPSLFQPNPDGGFGTASIVLWKKSVSGTPQSWESLTQDYWNPEFWFLTS